MEVRIYGQFIWPKGPLSTSYFTHNASLYINMAMIYQLGEGGPDDKGIGEEVRKLAISKTKVSWADSFLNSADQLRRLQLLLVPSPTYPKSF
jgi:hypothetical protein